MSKECPIRIYYEELPKKNVLGKSIDLFSYTSFNEIKKSIFKHSEKPSFDKVRLKEKDLFILKMEDFELAELNSIWDEETFKYLYSHIKQNPPEKLKFIIIKVKKYPNFTPSEYETLLKNALESGWESTKKEIEEDLNENYLNDGKRLFLQEKKENDENIKDETLNELNINIICNNCLVCNFSGARYVCAECNNFNLCEYCQESTRSAHNKEHTFIRFNEPVFDDIEKYNCIFAPNRMLLNKPFEPFEIDIDIMNNGDEPLQECFLSPIRFGKNYFGCLKTTITDECKNGEKIKLNVFMKFDDSDDIKDSYEGYFRLMTKEGLPFGDILYVQVMIEK